MEQNQPSIISRGGSLCRHRPLRNSLLHLVISALLIATSARWAQAARPIAVPQRYSPKAKAFIGDSHGNLQGKQAAIRFIHGLGVDWIADFGDNAGYGANPNECIALARKHCNVVLRGNHDHAAAHPDHKLTTWNSFSGAKDAMIWTRTVITEDNAAWLRSLSGSYRFDDVMLMHAKPGDEVGLCPHSYIEKKNVQGAFEDLLDGEEDFFNGGQTEGADMGFFAHTHHSVIWQLPRSERDKLSTRSANVEEIVPDADDPSAWQLDPESHYLINIGSVGQPRDGSSSLSVVIFEPELLQVIYQRISAEDYGLAEAVRAIKAVDGLPSYSAERLRGGI